MRIQIKTTNFDLTEAIAANVEAKIGSVGKHLQRSESDEDEVLARVEVGRTTNHHNKGEVFKAQVQLEIPGEPNVVVEAIEEDLNVAIDQVQEQLERDLRKSHEKYRDSLRKGGRAAKEMMHEQAIGGGEEE